MPCHNAGAYLHATLASIEAQSFQDFEIIAVEDNSTDGTAAILKEFETRLPLTWIPARCGSAAKSRNLAYSRSSGELVKFVDADDILSPDLLELQIARLKDHSDCVATARYSRFVNQPGERAFAPDGTWQDRDSLEWMLESLRDGGHDSMLQSGMFLIPRPLIEKAGKWDERLSLIDDTEYFGRTILAARRVLFAEGALYYRSSMAGSLSARKSKTAYESAAMSLELLIESILRREDSPRTRKVCADLCQSAFYDMHAYHPEIASRLARRVKELGGSDLRPLGGRVFQALTRLIGWRAAVRLRTAAQKHGYPRFRSVLQRLQKPTDPSATSSSLRQA